MKSIAFAVYFGTAILALIVILSTRDDPSAHPVQTVDIHETAQTHSVTGTAQANSVTGTAYATDGDTIKIDGTIRVRLSGVAAPERHEAGGSAATDFMARLVNGKTVRCELDGTRSHDRVVGTCFLGNQDIGAAVIAAGLARDCPRFSNGKYSSIERMAANSLPFPKYCRQR